jgi:hypothetical protein
VYFRKLHWLRYCSSKDLAAVATNPAACSASKPLQQSLAAPVTQKLSLSLTFAIMMFVRGLQKRPGDWAPPGPAPGGFGRGGRFGGHRGRFDLHGGPPRDMYAGDRPLRGPFPGRGPAGRREPGRWHVQLHLCGSAHRHTSTCTPAAEMLFSKHAIIVLQPSWLVWLKFGC